MYKKSINKDKTKNMNKLEAFKMDGLGNDFVIFDRRKKFISLTKEQIVKIADRNNVGCDQVIFINKDNNTNAFLEFFNSDGGEVSACGNGSRCVAYLLMNENKSNNKISLRTNGGILKAEIDNKNLVCLNIGEPNFQWEKIPLLKEMNHKNLKIKMNSTDGTEVIGGFSLSVGNPHIVFFVKSIKQFDLKEIGPKIENHKYFPEKCNVTLANIINKKHIKIKVWERGAGLTKACGTAACAAAVSGATLNLNNKNVDIEFPEGFLNINWKKNNSIYMTGKVSKVKKIVVNI